MLLTIGNNCIDTDFIEDYADNVKVIIPLPIRDAIVRILKEVKTLREENEKLTEENEQLKNLKE